MRPHETLGVLKTTEEAVTPPSLIHQALMSSFVVALKQNNLYTVHRTKRLLGGAGGIHV